MGQWAYLYAADQVTAFDFKNFVAVEQEQVVQLAQFTTEFARARIQRPSVSSEAVDVVLRGEVTLQQFTEHRRCLVLSLSIQQSTLNSVSKVKVCLNLVTGIIEITGIHGNGKLNV